MPPRNFIAMKNGGETIHSSTERKKIRMKTIIIRSALFGISLMLLSLFFTAISDAKIDLKTAVGIWLFDDGKGDVAKDNSDKGNNAKLKNSPKWVDGKFGKALEFNGKDNCVQTEKKLLDNLEDFSIVTWVKPGNLVGGRIGLVGQNDSPEFGFIDAGTVNLWTPVASVSKPYGHKFGEWHHVAATTTAKTMKVYIDGEAAQGAGGGAAHGTSAFNVNIGGCGVWDGDGNWFTGAMDEVAIFHSALEDNDIKAIMNDGFFKVLGLAVEPGGKLAVTWGQIKKAD
jgi:hypothetical protein